MNAIPLPVMTIADTVINVVDGLYSLNDLHKASGGATKHQPSNFMRNDETKALIAVIERSSNLMNGSIYKAYKRIKGGLNQGTYVCKELVYRYAMWISAEFSLMVIRAFDALTQSQFIPAIAEQRATISIEQQQAIRSAVAKVCKDNRTHYQTVYEALKKEFNIPRYNELLAIDFDEAMAFIAGFELPSAEIAQKPFDIYDYLNTKSNQIMDYVHDLERAVFELTGNYPKRPYKSDEIAKGVIGHCLNGQRVELSFEANCHHANLRFSLVDSTTLRIHDSNIAKHIELGNVNKKYLDDIIQASVKRLTK